MRILTQLHEWSILLQVGVFTVTVERALDTSKEIFSMSTVVERIKTVR